MPRTRSLMGILGAGRTAENRVLKSPMLHGRADNTSQDMSDPLASISASVTAMTILVVFLVASAGTLAVLSAQSAEPLVLTILAVLAMLGAFFVFGVSAGHIRIAERSPAVDLLEAIANQQDNGQLLTTLDGLILHANTAAGRMLGRNELGDLNSLEQALSQNHLAAEALFRLTRANQQQRRMSETCDIETGFGCNSDLRRYRISVKPFGSVDLPEYAGRAALWTIADITDEHRQTLEREEALRSELDHYANLPAGLLHFEEDGQIEFINRRLCEGLGFDTNEAGPPHHLAAIVARNDLEVLLNKARGQSDRTDARFDIDFVDAHGERWPAACIVDPRASKFDARRVCPIIVHPRFAVDFEQPGDQSSERRFAGLFRTAPFGIAVVEPNGIIAEHNPAFARLARGSSTLPDQCDALAAFALSQSQSSLGEIDQALEAARRGKADIQPVEIATGSDGEFARRVYVQSLRDQRSERGGAIMYITDATEERALGQKFAQSQKMEAVGKLAGGIAHDFNNVLTAIIGFSDLLLANHRPSDHAYKNIQNIRSSASHAASLVKQLLAFSRRQTLEPKVLQPNELITDLSVILNRLLGEHIELKISSARELWSVKADHNQLNQVIINLAVNARDAMPDGGRLTIRTRNISERDSQRLFEQGFAIGQYVMIEVEDTGTGMQPEVVAKIFEPFFTTKAVGKGTGLGLSTVYGIIKQTGGYVFADSTPGMGSTFRVFLPRHVREDHDVADAPKPQKRERAVDLTGHGRVLVVEDEDAVRIFATEALRRQGYDVLQASDGLEALDVMDDYNHEIDLVVSDVKMPEMDGPALFKAVRKTNPAIKFVFVSGYTDDAFTKTLDADAEYKFLPKPYTLAQIAEVVKEQLG